MPTAPGIRPDRRNPRLSARRKEASLRKKPKEERMKFRIVAVALAPPIFVAIALLKRLAVFLVIV